MQFAETPFMSMTLKKFIPFFAFTATVFSCALFAQEEPAPEADPMAEEAMEEVELSAPAAELVPITDNIMAALKAGEEVAQADLDALDALIEKYRGDTSEDVAQIFLTKAAFVLQVVGDTEAALPLFQEIATLFPDTRPGEFAGRVSGMIEEQMAEEALAATFVGSEAPEIDFTWVSDGEMAKLSDLRGKVVVLDFWATWCGPCVRSFPQVRELTDHYAGTDVLVVGVTSLQGQVFGLEDNPIDTEDDPAKEHSLMSDYMAKHDINWTVVFSEQDVFNDDYMVEGIPHMAIIAPDGTVRHTGMHPAAPKAEKLARIDAILEEFELPLPAQS